MLLVKGTKKMCWSLHSITQNERFASKEPLYIAWLIEMEEDMTPDNDILLIIDVFYMFTCRGGTPCHPYASVLCL